MKLRIVLLVAVLIASALLWQSGRAASPVAPIGFIGDSLTHSTTLPERTPELAGQLLGAAVVNRGIGGTTTQDWLPGGQLLAPALAAFRAAGVRVVQVALGTNDALFGVSATLYHRRLAIITRALQHADFRVVLAYPPAMVAGSMGGYISARAIRLLASYWGTHTTEWRFFAAHPEQLQDGVHPGTAGSQALARIWAAALVRALHD